MKLLRAIWQDRTGATAIEYGLIATMISIVALVAMDNMGSMTTESFQTAADKIKSGNDKAAG